MSMSIKEDRNKETAPVALNAVFLFIFSPIYIMSKMEFEYKTAGYDSAAVSYSFYFVRTAL